MCMTFEMLNEVLVVVRFSSGCVFAADTNYCFGQWPVTNQRQVQLKQFYIGYDRENAPLYLPTKCYSDYGQNDCVYIPLNS